MLCPALECSLSLVSVRRSALLSSVLCPQCLSDALPLVLECFLSMVPVRRSTPGSRVSSVLGDCQTLYPWFSSVFCPWCLSDALPLVLECPLSSVSVRCSALLSSVLCPWCLSDALPLVLECSLSSFCGACPPGDSENGCTGIHLFDFACLKVAVFYPHT